jgi:hypothetical protein
MRFRVGFARTCHNALRDHLGSGMLPIGTLSILLVCAALVTFNARSGAAGEQTLTGAWNVTIVFDDPALVGCTAPGLNSADGGVVAQGCDVGESPGYGQWRRIGNGEFAITFVGLNFGAAGTGVAGTYKVRATVAIADGNFSGPFLTEIFATDGTLLFSATGRVIGRPIAVEPL